MQHRVESVGWPVHRNYFVTRVLSLPDADMSRLYYVKKKSVE
jgi:hypothetical protein